MSRPKLLDLFCGAGGASKGLHDAGFDVTGVDLAPQPRYPYRFIQADALTVDLAGYDAYWASPLCQGYSVTQNIWQRDYPLLIEPIRALLQTTGKPWIIENVVGAPLDGITLCGAMFGLRVQRHRVFESNCLLLQPPHLPHRGARAPTGRPPRDYAYMTVAGHFSDVAWARQCMGIDWMTREELAEAIPPAYSAYLGAQLLRYVTKDAA